MIFFFIIIIAGVAWWIAAVVPRAREWIANCDDAVSAPFPSWAPPPGMEPLGVPFPAFDGVEWRSLSKEVDAEGVHAVDYASSRWGPGVIRRNPSAIAVFAIKRARRYMETRDETDLLLAARQIDYLIRSAAPVEIDGRAGVLWQADYPLDSRYNVRPPWRSAHFQIYALHALAWGHALSGESRLLDVVRLGLVPLGHSADEGGLCHRPPRGGLFFEEVVSSPPHHILNGHLHTLIGLNDLRAYTGWEEIDPIFAAGVTATVAMLPAFDRHEYSLYSLAPNPGLRSPFNIATPYYHRAHVWLLKRLYSITGERMFEMFAERWDARCGGTFDTLWSFLLIMFRDATRFLKSLRR